MKHYVIGDVHGAGLELDALLCKISPTTDDQVILVGDVFDRGEYGHEVWRIIEQTKAIVFLGNHERKMHQFLTGQRDSLPYHYYWAINNLLQHGVELQQLVDFLGTLPLVKQFEAGTPFIVAHAGVIVDDPLREDISMNVYGNLREPMPRPSPGDPKKYWWDDYAGDVPVYYGHLVSHDGLPRIRRSPSGKINSAGLDTAVVHGGNITAACPETLEFFQHKSGVDYFGVLKSVFAMQPPILHSDVVAYRAARSQEGLVAQKISK